MTADRIVPVAARRRRAAWTGALALVALDPAVCPACGNPTASSRPFAQPALFYFGGYGGMTSTTVRRCTACPWSLITHVATSTPRLR